MPYVVPESHEPREEIPWELFAGHLLDETKTRLRKSLESWSKVSQIWNTTPSYVNSAWRPFSIVRSVSSNTPPRSTARLC